MKKLIATLMVLALIIAVAATAVADEAPAFTFRNGVTFGMTPDEVAATETVGMPEVDIEHTHGPVTFKELEYEDVPDEGITADVKYLFVDEALVAIRCDYDHKVISYDTIRAELAAAFGEPIALELTVLGNGVYAVDDDGVPEFNAEILTAGDVVIVLEKDDDGDTDVTFLDLTAPYIDPAA